ncbi:hypothetical protein QB910_000114 [Dabrowskivirus KKP3916]|uniref:GmrSD restriction endonucleases N-terminal domain-containing protein n=1 Tax=Alicyclobacillus phage KKP_3916 TaxID=3040651 RepID=A0AAT9V7Q3_9CAUD|nr:hypothetical protein QB910_000114 [Alicyclobacillus phage KKP 3916]
MSFERSEKSFTIRQFVNKAEKGQLHFDLAIQRNEVWDNLRKSLLIHSILVGFPIPVLFAEDTGDNDLWFMDGKQRGSTILKFHSGDLVLHKDTPDVELDDGTPCIVANKTFEELPKELQNRLDDYSLHIWQFKNMTEEEKETMFLRLNNGIPLKQEELYRVRAGEKINAFVQEIKSMWFWKKSVNLSRTVKNRFGDEGAIYQILYLLDNNGKPVGFAASELNDFIDDIRERGIEADFKMLVKSITHYLGEAVPYKEMFLKKVNLPMLYVMANKAIQMGIPAPKFGGWAQQFFEDNKSADTEYSKACANGTGKVEKVRARLQAMQKHFDEYVTIAKNYQNDKWDKERAKLEAQGISWNAYPEVASTGESEGEQNGLSQVDAQDAVEARDEVIDKQKNDNEPVRA